MPSLVSAGDKINAEIEEEKWEERKHVYAPLFIAICVLECASMHAHVCIHKFMPTRMFPYVAEMLLHLSVCMCTFTHACAPLCTMCSEGCLPGS